MFIDAHSHGGHADRDAEGRLIPPMRPIWDGSLMSPEEYVKRAAEIGLEGAVILDPPEVTFELKRLFGSFVIPVPQVDLETVTPHDIDALFARGAVGIKFIAPGKPYCADEYMPIYERIYAHNGLADFHTGYLGLGLFGPGSLKHRDRHVTITDMSPATVDRVARHFPKLKILMSHYGNPWWEEAWKMTVSHKNIYADLSGGTAYKRDFEMWRQILAPNGSLDSVAISKICYGLDGSHFIDNFDSDLKMVAFYRSLLDFLKVPEELQQQVFRENILMLTDPSIRL